MVRGHFTDTVRVGGGGMGAPSMGRGGKTPTTKGVFERDVVE